MKKNVFSLLLLLIVFIAACMLPDSGPAEAGPDPCTYEQIVEEYRTAIHDPHDRSPFTETFASDAWRDSVDDPLSAPAYAIVEVNGESVLLIGDCNDPAGRIRGMYRIRDGAITDRLNDQDEVWYLQTNGKAVREEELDGSTAVVSIDWTRFWESRKAIVGAEDTGGLISRSGLGRDAYTLGMQETGMVIVVDEVTDGWAWYRYNAVRKGARASSWGYLSNAGLIYPDVTVPRCRGTLVKNGRDTGKAKINVRFRPTTKARKILELPIGTVVDIYGSENGWTEIEWNRWHGYVMDDFIRVP